MPQGPPGVLWKLFVVAGLILVAIGIMLRVFQGGLPLGRLPGDLVFRGRHVTVFIPLATALLVSLLLTVLVNLLSRR